MQPVPQWVQGVFYYDGSLFVTADDGTADDNEPDHLYRVAVAACAAYGLGISDYEPTLVKKSLVGTGRAEKEQVAFMVKRLLNVREADWALAAFLAVKTCSMAASSGLQRPSTLASSW